ncbi:MAG: hypothetical protein Q3985_04405 [Eubacteriales bacterium]|nr:hypothetical protein [Eubacteriales bacterium]
MKKVLSLILAIVTMAAMSVSAFAVPFVDSIEVKTAPKIIEVKIDGKSYGAVIIDASTEETESGVPMYDKSAAGTDFEFYVVSSADKEQAVLPEIAQNLTSAEEQIKNASDLGQLSVGLDKDIQKAIDTFYGNSAGKISITDLIVSDLFDASLVEGKDHLAQLDSNQRIRFMFKPNFAKNDFFVLLHNTEGTNWEVVNDVEWTDEGYLVVTVDSLPAFAIAMEKTADLPIDKDGPNAPQTDIGTGFNPIYAGIAVVCVGIAAFFFVKSKKKHEN